MKAVFFAGTRETHERMERNDSFGKLILSF